MKYCHVRESGHPWIPAGVYPRESGDGNDNLNTMNNLRDYLKKRRRLVDGRLDKLLRRPGIRPGTLHRAMRYSVFSGGKRVRPILAIEACRACGGRATDAMDAACAVEMAHAFSLIHDDLPSMDDDEYRRGKPSCHKKFGEATAILAGDALLTEAFGVLTRSSRRENVARQVREFSKTLGSLGMAGGQKEDLEEKNRLNRRDLDFITEKKTAALFKASMALGAMCAGADRKKESALSDYGKFIGMAFQFIDDTFDNDGYARLIGKDKTRKKAAQYIKKAKARLKIFGPKADVLERMADYMIERTK